MESYSVTQHDYFKIHPCYCVYQYFISFHCWIVFHCVATPYFIHHWWVFAFSNFGLLQIQILGYYKYNCYENLCTSLFMDFSYTSICPWQIPGSGMAGLYGRNMFKVFKKPILQRGCIIFHPHQQCMRVPLCHVIANTFCGQSFSF